MNRRFLPILVLLSWLFARCAREVTIDLPGEETKVVAVCHFTSDELFRVRVTLSQPVYASQDPEVPERAEVTIAQEGTFLDKLYKATDDNGNIYWESRDLAQTGVPYSITVRVDGYPNAEATSTIPVPTALKPLQTDPDHITEVPLSDGRRLMNIPLALHLEKLPAGQRYFGFYLRHDLDVLRGHVGSLADWLKAVLFIEGSGHLIAGPHLQKNPFRPVRQKLHELIGQTLTLIGFFHCQLGDFQLSSQVLQG